MTNQQLYFAVGIPIVVYLLGFTVTFFVMAWQARGVERRLDARLDGLKETMQAEFRAVAAEFKAMHEALLRVEQVADARIKWLEERAK